jgi:ubiquinone/menaquinone biosynthesis C-methylase UbiE
MLSQVIVANDMKVIDIGCGVDGRSFDDHVPEDWDITGVDIRPGEEVRHKHRGFSYVQQDAQDLSRFGDHEFDLAISIGMLEHITEESVFRRVVSELRRVARQHVVVVPYRYCWVEPHFGVPFFPLLPYSMKLAIVKIMNLSGLREAVTDDIEYINKNYRWLSNAQYRQEFPDSRIRLLPTLEMIAIARKAYQ